MSVKRDVIAETLGIPEKDVQCSNCGWGKIVSSGKYKCGFWKGEIMYGDEFCSFFQKRGDHG